VKRVRNFFLLFIVLSVIGLISANTHTGFASKLPKKIQQQEHPIDRIEAAKVAGEITPDEAALYKLYAFIEPEKLPSRFQFYGPGYLSSYA